MAEDLNSELSQYLSFNQGDEVFAIDIGKIREVLEVSDITKLPRTPAFMRGVINLRGKVVPIVDLKMKFGMGETVFTVDTCIIIVEIVTDGELTILGALTDSVREVIELKRDDIDPPPKIGTQLNTAFIQGMGKFDGDFIILLDVDKIFSLDELTLAKSVEQMSAEKLTEQKGKQAEAVGRSDGNDHEAH